MTTIVRRLRGIAVSAVSWGACWAIMGALFRVVWRLESGLGIPNLAMLLSSAISWIPSGVISGVVFALLVMGGGRQRVEDLTMRHAAIAGALAGGLLPFLTITIGSVVSGAFLFWLLPLLPQYAIAGGLCGAGSLALASRAARLDAARTSPTENSVAPAT
jgi:hypothetical protein